MYNPFMMNPMGGGMNNYWSPQRMQNAQPMGMYSQDAMQGAQKRDQMQGRVDNLQGRIGNLQEQYKAAGADQQAGIQNRINTLQGRMGDLQGKMDAGGGANRMGMEYRRERRQAKNAGTYDPNAQMGGGAEPAMWQGGMMPGMGGMGFGGMGFGGFGGFGGFPQGNYAAAMNVAPGQGRGGPMMGQAAAYGGITDSMSGNMTGAAPRGANRPGMEYRQDRRQARRQGEAGPTPVAPYNPQAAPQMGGGGNPAWGTPTDQFGNATSPAAYNQRMNSTNAELNAFNANNPSGRMPVLGQDVFQNMMGSGSFDTPFGNLVTASGGNPHLFKKNGMSEADGSYYYDPSQNQWNQISVEDYRRYGDQIDWNAMNPYGSEATARRAGATNASNYW